jgi:predicted aldo/keto reductase-like oxidoreductase
MPKQDFAKIVDDFFKENDISKIDMPIKDRKVVQQAIDYIAEYDDILTAKNGMSLRRKLDDLADWSTEATGE